MYRLVALLFGTLICVEGSERLITLCAMSYTMCFFVLSFSTYNHALYFYRLFCSDPCFSRKIAL